ncbi:MAG: MFS transporter [Ignavibacteriae bacterium]|nr:MFS transporter [Ignavibacteriota bacterium]MCB9222190.1 MFS transporter [Ignavibacteria bacterium]
METNIKYFIIIFSVTLMAVLGIASVSPALPGIAEHFNLADEDFGLIISVFAIPGILLTPVLGFLSDKFGRKIVIVPALLLFGVAGFMCSVAETFEMLLFFRFLQGVGAASLGALNVALIGDIFAGPDRPRIMGYNHSVLSIGTATFPIIGGILSGISYEYVFYMPLVAIPIAIYVLFFLDLDVKGKSHQTRLYFSSFLKLIKNRNLLTLLIVSISLFIILMGPFITYVPYVAKERFALEPTFIGIILASMSISTSLTAYFLGKFLKRFQHESLLKIGLLGYGLALGMIPLYNEWYMLFISTAIFGISHSFVLPNSQSMIIKFSDENNRALLMSFNRMLSQVGQALGPVLSGAVFVYFSDGIGVDGIYIVSVVFAVSILTIFSFFYNKPEELA